MNFRQNSHYLTQKREHKLPQGKMESQIHLGNLKPKEEVNRG